MICGTFDGVAGAGARHSHRPGVSGRERCARLGVHASHQAGAHRPGLRDRRQGASSATREDPFGYEVEGANYFDTEVDRLIGNGSLVLFGDGDSIDGLDGGRAGQVPADLRQAHRRAGRLVRPDRDEHPGGAASRLRGTAAGHVHQAPLGPQVSPPTHRTLRPSSACWVLTNRER